MSQKIPLTVAHGDGIQESGAALDIETIEIGAKVTAAGYDLVKTETLRTFDGQQGFTLAQGQ